MPSSIETVGGHKDAISVDEDDLLIKSTNATELEFYQSVNIAHSIYPHIPQFYGVLTLQPSAQGEQADAPKEAIVLENLTDYFSIPNICDIKLGRVLHEASAPLEKRQRMEESARTTTSHSAGMRFTGFKVWNSDTETYDSTGKEYGKSITKEQLPEALRRFIPLKHSLTPPQLKLVMQSIISQLQDMREAVFSMPFRAIASSILIVHEADADDFLEEQAAMVRLIDFAHTHITDDATPDTNILAGIDTLLELMYAHNRDIDML
ncbi:hypothetical protein E3P99_01328 [Wallemia hederae]|uniref:Kinase n=1 Tax=Wallemia hederae TaxID=1540922 RepID=A0A4T0FQQ0_9BASI|nr:hypothetical protein E3P99_01328 [Wallemia hederae]